jgi:pimeloyl-ACP methyl ester carboxylesterase
MKHGYAPVNGLDLYYEAYGSGDPIVLLHGGAGAIEMFGDVIHRLSKSRLVIGVDLQAHGRTADIERPLRYELMADDIAELLRYLKVEKTDVMGYSLGGGVALRTVIQHPDLVRKAVLVSTPFKKDGWYPEIQEAMSQGEKAAEPMKQTPLYELYSSIAPRVEDWPVMMRKLGEFLKRDYDWSKEVAQIKAPVMIVVGDSDSVRPSHAVEFFELLGGGKVDGGWDGSGIPRAHLAILPGTTHYNITSSPLLVDVIEPFLAAH